MICVGVHITRINGVKANITRLGSVSINCIRIDEVKLNVSIICQTKKYIIVTPKVLWVSPQDIKELLIKSNTDWNIT